MATQKKNTAAASGTRKKAAGSKNSEGKAPTKARSKASVNNAEKKSAAAQQRAKANRVAARRLYGAVLCFFLALLVLLSFFNNEAIFVEWIRTFFCGVMGYGYWLTPFALILAGYFLIRTRQTPFLGRVIAALLTPLVIGSLLHLCISSSPYPTGFLKALKILWMNGVQLDSGGAVSGMIALLLSRLISKLGAFLVLLVFQLFLLLKISNRRLADLGDLFRQLREELALRRQERLEAAYEDAYEDYGEEDDDYFEPQNFSDNDKLEVYEEPAPLPPQPRTRKKPKRAVGQTVHESSGGGKRMKKGGSAILQPAVDLTLQDPEETEETAEAEEVSEDEPLRVIREPEVPARVDVDEDGEDDEDAPILMPTKEELGEPEEIPVEPAALDVLNTTRKASPKETAAEAVKVASQAGAAMVQELPAYDYPPVTLLDAPKANRNVGVREELMASQARLEDTIQSFGIDAHIVDVTRGPTVARFELELDRGVKLSKITNLADDIALSLGVSGVRIAPVPDKMSVVGIEVPNRVVSPVPIREVLDSDAFRSSKSKTSFALGKNIAGDCVVGNIAKLPHLLIAGTTGSGKSVCINSLLISLLYKASPEEVRLIMVDPKKVELGIYNGIPHLLIPVVTEPKKAAGALQWAVSEMLKRYETFSELGVRKLEDYNRLAAKDPDRDRMPSIVIVIDELADLMLVAAKEVEESICRIAQLGRAAGMHLVVATQRPSADVITGLMKANIPSRIAFSVASAMESRIILDTQGAEKLVGKGDMLYSPIGSGKPLRVQGCLISDEEVAAVVEFIKGKSESQYDENVIHEVALQAASAGKKGGKGASSGDSEGGELSDYDELLPNAVDVVLEIGQASTSMLQRRLKLGYSRASRIVDQMEELGLIGPFEGSKPRALKITKEEWAVKRAELTGEAPPVFDLPQDEAPFDGEDESEEST